jgi:hypothetical protein
MKDLLSELMLARYRSAGDAMDEAEPRTAEVFM